MAPDERFNTLLVVSAMAESGDEVEEYEKVVEKMLEDPAAKSWLLQKLGLDADDTQKNDGENQNATQGGGGEDPPGRKNEPSGNLTLSGKSAGPPQWPMPPYWWPPYPGYPGMAPTTDDGSPFPPFLPQWAHVQRAKTARTRNEDDGDVPGTSGLASTPGGSGKDDEDVINLLDESEALELVEFDPSVNPKDSWEPSKAISAFLDKHFNRALSDSEREAIMKDFPKPSCEAMTVPKLDAEVKDQLKKKGKDPHFGAEKSLYKVQEQLLDVAGPLTCLWADLLNKEANISPEDILLLIQRALVLLGSTSHSISQERRKIAWSRINPQLKSLATEYYTKRD